MRHLNAWILMGAAVLVAALMMGFSPKPAPVTVLPPLHPGAGDGIVLLDGRAKIDINRADAWLLRELPGIGEVLAGALIDARPFASVDELLRVKGIGDATLAALLDKVVVID